MTQVRAAAAKFPARSSRSPDEGDDWREELDAMQAVGAALDALADDATRQRVLRWASQRFRGGIDGSAAAPAPGEPDLAHDPSLSLDGIDDLFDVGTGVVENPDAASDLVPEELWAADTPVPEPQPAQPERQADVVPMPRRPDPALDTLLRDFAAEMRRAAAEWQRD